jgi:primase-polymerase (primpol)-like protein
MHKESKGYYDWILWKLEQEKKRMDEKAKVPEYLTGKGKVEDVVNHPIHYNKSGIETIDAIKAMTNEGFEYYLQGNIMKYLWRYKYKNGVEDLEKAQWYLNKLISTIKDKYKD